jgi:lipid II:glycine glycyltransferase (peptidoglycan interpeptide bridge formation enzyme)
MENELTEEELSKIDQHRFYVNMSLKERLQVRDNMDALRERHNDIKLNQSKVLRKVMIEFMNDDDFLRYIGLL